MPNELTPEVRDLLAALAEAMNVPLPGTDDADEREFIRVAHDRTAVARLVLEGVLNDGHDLAGAAKYVRARTAEVPVTYAPWPEAYEQQ
jgi:hypothetical protein